jgi:hypothetical protein
MHPVTCLSLLPDSWKASSHNTQPVIDRLPYNLLVSFGSLGQLVGQTFSSTSSLHTLVIVRLHHVCVCVCLVHVTRDWFMTDLLTWRMNMTLHKNRYLIILSPFRSNTTTAYYCCCSYGTSRITTAFVPSIQKQQLRINHHHHQSNKINRSSTTHLQSKKAQRSINHHKTEPKIFLHQKWNHQKMLKKASGRRSRLAPLRLQRKKMDPPIDSSSFGTFRDTL